MNKFKTISMISACLSLASLVYANMGEDAPVSHSSSPAATKTPGGDSSESTILNRFSGMAGADFRSTGGDSQLMPALGLRYYPVARWNAVWLPNAYEVGGSWS